MNVRLYKIALSLPKTTAFFLVLLTFLGFYFSNKLTLDNNLVGLLPKNFESVQALETVKNSFGGMGYTLIAVEGGDPTRVDLFLDELGAQLKSVPEVNYLEGKDSFSFFKNHQWLYFELSDLKEMESRLDRSLEIQKKGFSPTFNALVDFADESDRPDLSFSDIQEKYKKSFLSYLSGNRQKHDNQMTVVKLKLSPSLHDLEKTNLVLKQIDQIAQEISQKPAYEGMKVYVTGDHIKANEEVSAIRAKMFKVSSLVFVILALVLWVYFRRITDVFLVGIPLMMGIIWTGGIVYLFIGHLNIFTGFATAILSGLGSDYGIYLLSRYYQEREAGTSFLDSCDKAFAKTGKATFGSMLATLIAFLALLISSFKGFYELGIVGAVGILMNYIAMMLFLPMALYFAHVWKEKRKKNLFKHDFYLGSWGRLFYPTHPYKFVYFMLVLVLLLAPLAFRQLNFQYEDGRINTSVPSQKIYDEAVKVLGGTIQPTLLVVSNVEDEKKNLELLGEQLKTNAEYKKYIKSIIGFQSLIPEKQDEKILIINRLIRKFEKSIFPPKNKKVKLLNSFQTTLSSGKFSSGDIPQRVRSLFLAPLSDLRLIYVYPNIYINGWKEMEAYASFFHKIKEENKLNFQWVDTSFIAYDFVKLIKKEIPLVMFVTFLSLVLILLFVFKNLKNAFLVSINLIGGLILLSGICYLLNIRFNTMNVVGLPIVLGTGINCFIHFGLRFEESKNVIKTIHSKLLSIFVSNLTTAIGFGGLIFVSSAGLSSLGLLVVIGTVLMTFLCSFVYPRMLIMKNV